MSEHDAQDLADKFRQLLGPENEAPIEAVVSMIRELREDPRVEEISSREAINGMPTMEALRDLVVEMTSAHVMGEAELALSLLVSSKHNPYSVMLTAMEFIVFLIDYVVLSQMEAFVKQGGKLPDDPMVLIPDSRRMILEGVVQSWRVVREVANAKASEEATNEAFSGFEEVFKRIAPDLYDEDQEGGAHHGNN